MSFNLLLLFSLNNYEEINLSNRSENFKSGNYHIKFFRKKKFSKIFFKKRNMKISKKELSLFLIVGITF